MSITVETAKAHEKDPAVLCCRFEAGTVIEPSNLEDPAIFPDLVDSGLLQIGEDTLTIGEVLGAKLIKTSDALTPLTKDLLEGLVSKAEEPAEVAAEEKAEATGTVEVATAAPVSAPVSFSPSSAGSVKINIGEGKNISLEIPLSVAAAMGAVPAAAVQTVEAAAAPAVAAQASSEAAPSQAPAAEEKVLRSLKRRHFKIDTVKLGKETKIEGTTLFIRKGIELEAAETQELVVSVKMEIITPEELWQVLRNHYGRTAYSLQGRG